MLRETQSIKSEGDFEAAKNLVENYGVKVDQAIHKEVLDRNSKFKSPPYSGFVNPVLFPETDDNGEIKAIRIDQPTDFATQMLQYAKDFNYLPVTE